MRPIVHSIAILVNNGRKTIYANVKTDAGIKRILNIVCDPFCNPPFIIAASITILGVFIISINKYALTNNGVPATSNPCSHLFF